MSLRVTSQNRYTYADLADFPDDTRWELIDGVAYAMSSPSSAHQMVLVELTVRLFQFFKGSPCRVLTSPMDIKLSETNVVQPDLLVVCNPDQIQRAFIAGPPQLLIEVLSPSTQRHDRIRKMNLYARFGVPEYWILNVQDGTIEVYHLDGKHYMVHGSYDEEQGTLVSPSFPGLNIVLKELFGSLPAEVREAVVDYEAAPV